MDPTVYPKMREIEDRHWWFIVRRRIIADMLNRLELHEGARILDAGCGTGGNLEMLSHYGDVTGLEMESSAAEFSRVRGMATIVEGYFPDQIPVNAGKFDLVTMIDVLEHIDDDVGTLSAVKSLLAANGHLLVTVPAFQFLWSSHDEMHHHKRRYRKHQLVKVFKDAGLDLQYISYFNFWLFPVAVVVRLASRLMHSSHAGAGDNLPAPLLNYVLALVFNSERSLLRWTRLPFGLSLIAFARKV